MPALNLCLPYPTLMMGRSADRVTLCDFNALSLFLYLYITLLTLLMQPILNNSSEYRIHALAYPPAQNKYKSKYIIPYLTLTNS